MRTRRLVGTVALAVLPLTLVSCSAISAVTGDSGSTVNLPVESETPDTGAAAGPVTVQKKTQTIDVCTVFTAADINKATNDEMEGIIDPGNYCVVSTKQSMLAISVMAERYDPHPDGTKLRFGGNQASQKLTKASGKRLDECDIVVQLNSINEFGDNALNVNIANYDKESQPDVCGVARKITQMIFDKIPTVK
ncbi:MULTISPECIES: hypothetical protein [unclassified Kitasatospora]|uniref:hypothetical protein n=1 Tax=unclassified Kitasatospora TaxID=2633591 RepID=UPI00070DA4A1|nr:MULTISPECIES: hypothetical protein [unclassified Kitasatospora]KQV11674.1 hypothetical protein ASC99_09445 [Kitasatospora sp. Root107]KRB76742.1 hypothetical protein ASE03_13935 [Kitasatospora sp. Root187]